MKSLFINFPFDFTLKLLSDKLFIDQSTKIFGMNRKHFKKVLDWTCKNGTLQSNGKFFKQVHRRAMGSPFVPAIADICANWLLEEVQYLKRPLLLSKFFSTLMIDFWLSMILKIMTTHLMHEIRSTIKFNLPVNRK